MGTHPTFSPSTGPASAYTPKTTDESDSTIGGTVVPHVNGVLIDGVNPTQRATVAQFHNADNQNPGNAGFGLLTGGVAQLLNASGNIDRQRETGSDVINNVGIATGTQQLAWPVSAGPTVAAITASASPQTVTLAAVSGSSSGIAWALAVGSALVIEPNSANQETVTITAINVAAKTVTAVFTKSHASGVAVTAFFYDQARSAIIPDGSTGQGIAAGGTYLFNAALNGGVGGWEAERSFLGELNGATGKGGNIAAEFEDVGGGPVLASGVVSGLRLMAAQALMGKGRGTGTITATTVGATSVVFPSAAATNTVPGGHALYLSGGTAPETVFVSPSFVAGSSATVPLISPVVNAGQTSAAWDAFAANGPGLNGFLPHGIGIEEEALFDPVSGLYYVERAATQDAMPAQNIVAEAPVLWNGSTFDRARGALGVAQVGSGLSSTLNITAATVVKASPGRLVRVSVIVAGTAAGSANDVATTGAAAAANQVLVIPNTVGPILLDWPCAAGIVVTPGTGQTVAVSYV